MIFKFQTIFAYKDKVLTSIFLIMVFIYLLSPIADLDFPWHLKSGEYIVRNKTIPIDDIFSHTHEGFIGKREKFQLSQYWLAQVMFYGIYSAGGPMAIVIFRTLLFFVFFVLLWLILRKRGLYYAIFFSILSALLWGPYKLDSPTNFSTVFVLILLLLLEKFRGNPSSIKFLIFIPPLMLLWSNLHGGYVFGIVLIVIYALSETVKYLFFKFKIDKFGHALKGNQLFILSLLSLISITFSYLNPNGFGAIEITLESFTGSKEIKEFYSSIQGYLTPIDETRSPYSIVISNISYWILLGYVSIVVLLSIIRKKALELTSLSLIVFSAIASFTALRYIPLFLAVSIPFIVVYPFFKGNGFLNKIKDSKFVYAIFLVFFLIIIVYQLKTTRNLFKINESRVFPVRAADFLIENQIDGNIFNSYNKGGYLLWRLYPRYKVFFDSRVLNFDVIRDGMAIEDALRYQGDWSYPALVSALSDIVPKDLGKIEISVKGDIKYFEGKPLWKEILDKYRIDLIVHDACRSLGQVYALTLRLLQDNDWVLIYIDGNTMIFLRDKLEYKHIIERYKKPKELIYTQIILETSPLVKSRVAHPTPYSSLAFSLLAQDRIEEAKKMVEASLTLDKKDVVANFCNAYIALKENKLEKEKSRNP